MSDLQRSWAKAKLAGLPHMLPDSFNEADEEGEEGGEADSFAELPIERSDDDSSSASSASSTGTIKPTLSNNLFARPAGSPKRKSLSPIPWTAYFERTLLLPHPETIALVTHHVYLTSPAGPTAPLFLMHHGAGSSGLTFALFASEIRKLLPHAGILSLDARGHGLTTVMPNPDLPVPEVLDFSLATLSADVVAIVNLAKDAMGWPAIPPLVLVGHSLGGSVLVDVADSGLLGSAVLGYVVLDMVEKTAMDALSAMSGFLAGRPSSFRSLDDGIAWHVRTGAIRNAVSARVSSPPLLRLDEKSVRWVWFTDLMATEPFWEGWFEGLSAKFLRAKGGKMLILAGTDRLDKDMMIGQMQGKYALQVFTDAGHFLHEDQPERTALAVVEFYKRNDRSALVLPPKVSDLLKAGKKV